jgi:hypothetical protein
MTLRGGFLAVVGALVAFTLVLHELLRCFVAAALEAMSALRLVAAGTAVMGGRSSRRAVRSVSFRRVSLRVARDDGTDSAEAKGDRRRRAYDAWCGTWTLLVSLIFGLRAQVLVLLAPSSDTRLHTFAAHALGAAVVIAVVRLELVEVVVAVGFAAREHVDARSTIAGWEQARKALPQATTQGVASLPRSGRGRAQSLRGEFRNRL